jgi:excisionase family DNA binding protein
VSGDSHITVQQAAILLGISARRVQQLAKLKLLKAWKPGFGDQARWRISKSDVERYVEVPTNQE